MSDTFDSSDSVRSGRPLKYAQSRHLPRAAGVGAGRAAARGDRRLRDLRAAQPAGRQRRAGLPCPVGRFARRPARRRRRSRLVGRCGRAGQADRHRSLFRDLPERAGRLPRHDRPEQRQPGDRPALRHRLPRHHRRRHRRGAAAVDRPLGHRAAAGGDRRIAGRPHGADLGHAIARPHRRRRGRGHLAAADQPGAGLRRCRPQRHPPRSGLPARAVLRPGQRARPSGWPSRGCSGTSPTCRARR